MTLCKDATHFKFSTKTLVIRKVAKDFKGNPGMSKPSFSINSLISRIQTQFYQALYRGLDWSRG